jgi:hypothetical protein
MVTTETISPFRTVPPGGPDTDGANPAMGNRPDGAPRDEKKVSIPYVTSNSGEVIQIASFGIGLYWIRCCVSMGKTHRKNERLLIQVYHARERSSANDYQMRLSKKAIWLKIFSDGLPLIL